MRSTISTYHDAEETDTGPPLLIASPVNEFRSFLSHISYVSIAICELSLDTITENKIYVSDLTTRIRELITHIHQEYEVQNVLIDYFRDQDNVIEIVEIMAANGLLKIHEDHVHLTSDQLDFLKINVLDYFT